MQVALDAYTVMGDHGVVRYTVCHMDQAIAESRCLC